MRVALVAHALLLPLTQRRAPSIRSTEPLDVPTHSLAFRDALDMLHSSGEAASEQHMRLWKQPESWTDKTTSPGSVSPPTVYLVGVGPGDVELLTLKALRVMGTADLVLYDRLISPEILKLVNPEAAMLYVGKEAGLHTRSQEEIHELLLQFALNGKTVCRLKGGDPTVFGRGGEEMEYLEAHGIPVTVVPGITAASGIAACLGIPLTHRNHADAVRFVTGHARSECSDSIQDRYAWQQLADPRCTLVIYMGLSTLPELTAGLIGAGLPFDTPAVAVQDGTTQSQRVVSAPLGSLHHEVSAAGLRSPTLVLIGQVVSLLKAHEDRVSVALENAAMDGGQRVDLTAEDVAREIAQLRRGH